MVGCSLLLQVSQALTEAKGNTALFGGVNMIFAGDFAQLPPVGETKLYAKINTDSEGASGKRGQENILGKLLWLSVKTVVTLKHVERVHRKKNDITGEVEADPEAEKFVQLLARLREGRCTDADFETLNSRNVPVIVSKNELKDALNERAARAYAARSGNDLQWYYARD
ncbi:hypothetical protein B0H17DRAFT_897441, partial [Mycena rosella]